MVEMIDQKNWTRPQLEKYARGLWKKMVTEVGAAQAREIMRCVMGSKKPGPRLTEEQYVLTAFIYSYILNLGQRPRKKRGLTDRKIALLLFESKPQYVQLESGALFVVNDHITDAELESIDDPVVDRWPINKSLEALEKQVERVRRWAIQNGMLSEQEYAPRQYYRD